MKKNSSPQESMPHPHAIPKGQVWLVGAGPGDPGLLTQWALVALRSADVVVYDALVGDNILSYRKKGARLIYAGKRGGKPSLGQDDISKLLIKEAKQGHRVCRLKGGDPFVFGRGAEETMALKQAGINYRVVPGITSGVAGLGYAGIPLTSRDTNSAVIFLTGHGVGKAMAHENNLPQDIDWQAIAKGAPTLVLYMAIKNAKAITEQLLQHGRDKKESIAIISHATTNKQKIWRGTLTDLPMLAKNAETPAIVVIGKNVDLMEDLAWWSPEKDWHDA